MSVRPSPSRRRLRRPSSVTVERWVAYRTISRSFEEGAYADRAFSAEAERAGLDGRGRSQAQRLAYGTVQRAKTLDHVIAEVGKRPLKKLDPPVLNALRLGLFQTLLSDHVADHAAVDQTVEIVRGVCGERPVAFANAIMRRAGVDGPAILGRLDPTLDSDLAVALSLPDWMVATMRADFGQQGVDALAAQNAPLPTKHFRRNRIVPPGLDESAWATTLAQFQSSDPSPLARVLDGSLAVDGPTEEVQALVEAGAVLPQSLASMLVVSILDPQDAETVVDMCAAPGGKTTDIAARARNVVAVELHEHRARELRSLCSRLGARNVEVVVGDARTVDLPQADRVLVDAPCSGLGVLRGRPDLRWKRADADLDELTGLQRELLARAAQVVRPSGVVVYSTCTMTRQENEDVVDWAVEHTGLRRSEIDSQWCDAVGASRSSSLRTWPHLHETDGFFVARLCSAE